MGDKLFVIITLAILVFSGNGCYPDWYSECDKNEDCCTLNCFREVASWDVGVCYPIDGDTDDNSTVGSDTNSTCLALWASNCINDSQCCSKYCWRGDPDWTYGVCEIIPCDSTVCSLPNCSCSDKYVPGNLTMSEIPQMVFLTFDDANSEQSDILYKKIFTSERKNPNGARITGTFYVSHESNFYTYTNEYYDQGHEIALHSITHKDNYSYWENLDEDGWFREVGVQREMMSRFANIPAEEIIGFRTPFLQGSGDSMYQFLYKNDFVYDSSRPAELMMWPYTADLPSIQDCVIPPCPTELYKGFWVFPMVEVQGKDGNKCVMADSCDSGPTSADEAYDFLFKNFLNHYGDNRAPFGVYAHATWFESNPSILEGYCRFVDKILKLGDVYVVSAKKGLDWIRNPVPRTGKLPKSWNDKSREYTCPITYYCEYESANQLPPGVPPSDMTSCSPCPPKYPWTDNPLGEL